MHKSVFTHLALVPLLFLGPILAIRAGEKEQPFTANGEIVLPRHKVKMEKDQIYLIEIKAKGWTLPNVLVAGAVVITEPVFPRTDASRQTEFVTTYTPKETKEYDLLVTASPFVSASAKGNLEYTLSVRRLPTDLLMDVSGEWTKDDPKYQSRINVFKAYPIKMKAGATYIIDLSRVGKGKFPNLVLEDENQKNIAFSSGIDKIRLVYTSPKDGAYRIIATTGSFDVTGEFKLTVRGRGDGKEGPKK